MDKFLRLLANKQYVEETRQRVIQIMRDTTPANRASVECAIHHWYGVLGKTAPPVIWVDSPRQAVIAKLALSRSSFCNGRVRLLQELPVAVRKQFVSLLLNTQFLNTKPVIMRHLLRPEELGFSFNLEFVWNFSLEIPKYYRGKESRPIEVFELFGSTIEWEWELGFDPLINKFKVDRTWEELFQLPLNTFGEIYLIGFPHSFLHMMVSAFQPKMTPKLLELALLAPILSPPDNEIADSLLSILGGCGGIMATGSVIIAMDRPDEIIIGNHTTPEKVYGLAFHFRDGFQVYSLNGIRVTKDIWEGRFDIGTIENETHAERRRILLNLYGLDRYLQESGAQLQAKDSFGELYIKELPIGARIMMLKVINATPEPDGSYKSHVLRVPPTMTSPHEAVAWTFGLPQEEYQPDVET
ncbi:MAG: hypothetical protein OEW39_04930 [Deltaproteobacteria bacterium]|nr:hypothetical protein [Deltaproteobacteria bacterium]